MMRIDLDAPLLPRGGTVNIGMQYAFTIPDHGSDRMGRDSALYEIAQWYPCSLPLRLLTRPGGRRGAL